MRYSRIALTPASGALGAEVSGVDLSCLDDETFEEIHAAWLEHQVLFFRDQKLTPGDQTAFAQRFGELEARFREDEQNIVARFDGDINRFKSLTGMNN